MATPFPYTPIASLPGTPYPVHALAYSAAPAAYILTGSGDRAIRLYNPFPASSGPRGAVQPGKLVQTFEAHGYEVLDLCVASDNARFASCGGDRSVFLWDVATAKTTRRFGGAHGHTARINTVAFAGVDESVLVSGSFDASVRLWDAKASSMKPIQVLSEARDAVQVVLVSPARPAEVLAGSVDGRVRCYDVRMGRCVTDVVGEPVTSLCVTGDGEGVLVGSLGGVRLMDRGNGGCLMRYEGAVGGEFRIRSCFGGRGERWVVSGSEADGEVVAWDTMTGGEVARVKVPRGVEGGKKRLDAFGKERERKNVVSCVAWRNWRGKNQWCCAGTDGAVTVFGDAD
ncbi:hypothetical protein VE03_02132 [Pseudogymnoascus sp. 23342-1-I1]|nr:hypothetical protein VE03_02132 [Pseudogymnoascus sp. 23342-1-I1]